MNLVVTASKTKITLASKRINTWKQAWPRRHTNSPGWWVLYWVHRPFPFWQIPSGLDWEDGKVYPKINMEFIPNYRHTWSFEPFPPGKGAENISWGKYSWSWDTGWTSVSYFLVARWKHLTGSSLRKKGFVSCIGLRGSFTLVGGWAWQEQEGCSQRQAPLTPATHFLQQVSTS